MPLSYYFSEKKFADPSFGKHSVDFFFAYDETVTIASQPILAFATFAWHVSNMLTVQKEQLFIKSPKLQISHPHYHKLKSRSF